ncbi:MAG: Ribosomal RNA small subunit methyltransferase E [Candidatus Hydrogenedentes bacterium ADurb.Bin179]|nr:MAG: Ribosomal RNA small subunit methyltransferase E [Candidatus Hydrogenedentes bacterium ADurb.Bin179]
MSHPHRFYAPFAPGESGAIRLPSEEAHHALRVARLRQGDPVSVINGQGDEIRGLLSVSGKQNVYVEVREQAACPPPPVALTLALGGLHQEKALQEVIRRAVETGFSRICFWQAEHSQKPVAVHDKCFKTALETCKQCGRLYVPVIDTAPSLEQFLTDFDGPGIIGVTEMEGKVPEPAVIETRLAIVVGPEGDFSVREREVVEAFGLTPVSLGKYIYRSETAAAMLMTLAASIVGELGPPLPISCFPSADPSS